MEEKDKRIPKIAWKFSFFGATNQKKLFGIEY
jgi:hypothetical protein